MPDQATQILQEPVLESEPDLRLQVPDLLPYLKADEKVVEVIHYPDINKPATAGLPSSMAQLLRFTGVEKVQDAGVLVASKAEDSEGRQELKAYEVVFGRDSLIVAEFLRPYYLNLFRSTILKMASLQGLELNPMSEEESGKIVHEARDPHDPIAQEITSRLGWQWPYYGAIDSTPLYVKTLTTEAKDNPDFLLEKYVDKAGHEQSLLHSLDLAMEFIENSIAKSPLGLMEYKRLNPNGLQNQWWADSWDSMSDHAGRYPNFNQPIAALHVQALAYDALRGAADVYHELTGGPDAVHKSRAAKYEALADNIRQQLFTKFWKTDGEGGFFIVGLDRDDQGNYHQLDTKTAHMGLLLNSRLFDDRSTQSAYFVDRTVNVISSDEMQNASGLRTLSKKEKHFKPGGYHTGNVWLWVNNWVANGLDRQARNFGRPDYSKKAWELREKTWRVVQKFKKFPELVNGGDGLEPRLNDRRVVISLAPDDAKFNLWSQGKNTIEQPAQDYQAWTIAAYIDALRKNNPL